MARLLIVDDSNVIRSRIERIYEGDGDIEIAGKAVNGHEAVDFVKNDTPDIVTMDLTMPEMDGIGCIQALMEIDRSIKILVVSALSDKATGIEAISKGARGFLCKPFTDDELRSAMEKLLSSKDRG
jgi:two-component system chemotaxis response regulator CheY